MADATEAEDASQQTTPESSTNNNKPRQKRRKYVTCACFECKRRKIKCNGNQPCERCSHLKLECEYPTETRVRKRSKVEEPCANTPPPLFGIPSHEAKELLEVYDSELNSMYPIFYDGELLRCYEELERIYITTRQLPMGDKKLTRVKLAMAVGAGISNKWVSKAQSFYREILAEVYPSILTKQGDIDLLLVLLLIHEYQFHTDHHAHVAYRSMAFACAIVYELGLNRREELERNYLNPVEREYYKQVFWCTYVFDRRMSIYTKRPVILSDDEIDQRLPQLHGSGLVESTANDLFRAMHLNYMVHYSQIATKVLKGGHDENNLQYLEQLMKRWMASLPPELNDNAPIINTEEPPPMSRKLKSVMHLKSQLMLLQIYTASSSKSYTLHAVNAARECVKDLYRLYFNTSLYKSCQIQYNHFLVSALDVLYSATQQNPEFKQVCSHELNLALKLVNLILADSNEHQGYIWQLIASFAVKLGYKTKGLENGAVNMEQSQTPVPTTHSQVFDQTIDMDEFFRTPFQISASDQNSLMSLLNTTTYAPLDQTTPTGHTPPQLDNSETAASTYKTLEDLFKSQMSDL